MHKVFVALIAVFFSVVVVAEEPKSGGVVETELFKMQLPPGWKEVQRDAKVVVLKNSKQTAEISIARTTGEGTKEQMERASLKLKERLRGMVASNAENQDYLVVQKLQEKQVANGNVVISTKLRTRDNQSFVHQYAVPGPRAGLLITVEGPVAEIFAANMFEFYVITSVRWK